MNISGYDRKLAEALQEELCSVRDPKGAAISAAVVINGRIAASCAVGVCGDGVTPASTEDLFNIGSISKVYCAMALCRLERQGKLRLDDRISQYLPDFRTRDPRDRDITIRMLLNHTSGLPGTNSRNMIDPEKIAVDRRASNYKYWSRAKLKAAPGEYSTYCNEGFELAAEIVENVSGMEYLSFLKKEILSPLGLRSHRLATTQSDAAHPVFMIGQAEELICAKGAGAVSCTMEDNALFGYAFLHPGAFSREEIENACAATGKTFLQKDEMSTTYGLGWDAVEITEFGYDLGEHALRKGGATLQFTSYLVCIPKFDMTVSLSATYDCGFLAGSEIYRLIAIAAEHCGFDLPVREYRPAGDPPADPAAVLQKYCGVYYGSDTMYRLSIDGAEMICETDDGTGWKAEYRLPLALFDGQTFHAGKERICFEEHDGITYLLTSDFKLGVPVNPTGQMGNSFGELPEAWKKRIGKRYITADLTERDLELDGPFVARIFEIGDGVVSFAVTGKTNGILSARPCGDDDTELFVNGPGYGSMNLWAPYYCTENGRDILAIFDYDFICADDLPVLGQDEICVAPGRNAVYRLNGPAKLSTPLPKGVFAAAVAENGALNAVVQAGGEEKTLDGAYLLFLCDDCERSFTACLTSISM